jgi:lipid A 4'-phosphatase
MAQQVRNPEAAPGSPASRDWRGHLWQIALHPVVVVAAATIVVSVIAIAYPTIDQATTRMFYDGAGRFPARNMPALRAVHVMGYWATYLVVAALLALLVARLSRSRFADAVSWRAWWFLTLGLALGPGLIVNGLLKPLTNRPRPVQTDLFGGHHPFVAAWSLGESGLDHRSFASGEAAAAMYLVAFAFVVAAPWRKSIAGLAVLWAFVISLNRIAFGAHYLSDVLVAWGMTLAVVLQLRSLLLADTTGRASAHGT